MNPCCHDKTCELERLRKNQSSTLKIALFINVLMFIIELGSGLLAHSTALLADSLDNLGDALTYAVSLYAIDKGPRTKAHIALFKGALILVAGLFVIGQVIHKLLVPAVPIFEMMGIVSLLAILANGTCFILLWRHRDDDINMSSVWECSRNDLANNIAVIVAAAGVWLTASGIPDIIIGSMLALLFLRSAVHVLRSALKQLNT